MKNSCTLRTASIALLVALLAATASAEVPPARFGVMAGLNRAGMGEAMDLLGRALEFEVTDYWPGDWTSEATRSDGLALGAYFAFTPEPRISLQVEGQYVQRGMHALVGFEQGLNLDRAR